MLTRIPQFGYYLIEVAENIETAIATVENADFILEAEPNFLMVEAGETPVDLTDANHATKELTAALLKSPDPDAGVIAVEIDIFKDRIFVLTPRGEIKDLPANSTPIDFAYAVHTDVGHKCVMAKVNKNIVSLSHELKNSDVVEIITKRENLGNSGRRNSRPISTSLHYRKKTY